MNTHRILPRLMLCFLVAGLVPAIANAQQTSQTPTIIGTLSNFDAVNDTGGETEGFEIQLEGIQTADVAYEFGQAAPGAACYIRYCSPQLIATPTGVIVRWSNNYDPAAKQFVSKMNLPGMPLPTAGTPVPAQANIANLVFGHQCWTGGQGANYPTSGCEHFGLMLVRQPTTTTYRWLVGDPATGILSVFGGAPVAIPQPQVVVIPPPPPPPGLPPAPPAVQQVVVAPKPIVLNHRYGKAQWVKVYKTESQNRVDLDQLMADGDGNVVPDAEKGDAAETEWKLLQFDVTNPDKGASQLVSRGNLGNNSHSVTRRYEFYKYSGPVVAPGGITGKKGNALSTDDQEASQCQRDVNGECIAPGPGELGDFIGAQMAAANLGGDIVLIPQVISLTLPESFSVGDPDLQLSAIGGGSGNPVRYAATGACSLSDFTHLRFNSVGTCSVSANQAGSASFSAAQTATATTIVKAAAPKLLWSAPAPIVYGAALSALQLSATSSVAGTISYDPPAGTILPVGTSVLHATLIPADPAIASASLSVQIEVRKAVLTLKADDKSRAFGSANPALTFSISGFVNGDSAAALSGAPEISTSATPASKAGSFAIRISGGTLSASNYSFSFSDGQLTISKASLSITPVSASRTYGSANPSFSASFSGFAGDDGPESLIGTPSFSTDATQSSGVGTYDISVGGVSSDNYEIHGGHGKLTITPAPLSLQVADASRAYGSPNPDFSASFSGFVLGEGREVLSGSLSFSTDATQSSGVGSFSINAGGVSAANYEIHSSKGTLTITPAPLSLQVADASRVYGSPNPDFSASFSGFVLGEGREVLSGSLSFSTDATQSSGVGSFSINAGGVSAANYSIHSNKGTLTITPATLFVKADDQQIDFGAPVGALTSSISGFVLNDDSSVVSGSAVLTADTFTTPGTFAIKADRGTLSAANYTFQLVPGTLTVLSPRQVLQDVLSSVTAFRATASSSVASRLDDAISKLSRGADASIWSDGSHPTLSSGGEVFNRTSDAVSKLIQAAGSPANATLSQAVTRIVRADRGLLVIAISDAHSRGLDSSRIAKASAELAQSDSDAAAGRFTSSIGHDSNGYGALSN